ncbi:hypothetical protein [Burkholderia sp. Nafp2/4-1b]|uniref:hypothetical protein n=1 Tax=Burkholderia sp. Nafp2/4-1b TaxID=2116686 RepID=UPI0013CEB024|nr:hypothetical protein [Burkholderia sp. Nafp2/4-1b]
MSHYQSPSIYALSVERGRDTVKANRAMLADAGAVGDHLVVGMFDSESEARSLANQLAELRDQTAAAIENARR